MTTKAERNIAKAYKQMASQARYRPAAPSDGFGNITVPLEDLDLTAEALEYAKNFTEEENTCSFWIGCTDYSLAPATVYAIEAARNLCGVEPQVAKRLLLMAIKEIDRGSRP